MAPRWQVFLPGPEGNCDIVFLGFGDALVGPCAPTSTWLCLFSIAFLVRLPPVTNFGSDNRFHVVEFSLRCCRSQNNSWRCCWLRVCHTLGHICISTFVGPTRQICSQGYQLCRGVRVSPLSHLCVYVPLPC